MRAAAATTIVVSKTTGIVAGQVVAFCDDHVDAIRYFTVVNVHGTTITIRPNWRDRWPFRWFRHALYEATRNVIREDRRPALWFE